MLRKGPLSVHPDRVPLLARVVTTAALTATLSGAGIAQAAPAVEPATIYAIGDSWAAGLYADPEHTLIQDAAADLHMTAAVDGESGSGYLTAPLGTRTYPDRAASLTPSRAADIVIVQGGSNDDSSDLRALPAAVDRTVGAIRTALPRATVVLLGPGPDPWPITGVQRQVDRIIHVEAARLGVRYISPMDEDWFTSDDVDSIIDATTYHPTAAGDAVLGAKLAADLGDRRHGSRRLPAAAWLPPPPQRSMRARRPAARR